MNPNRFSIPLLLLLLTFILPVCSQGLSLQQESPLQDYLELAEEYNELLDAKDLDRAESVLEDMRDLAADHPELKARWTYDGAMLLLERNEYDRATEKFNSARSMALELADTFTLGHSLLEMGILWELRYDDSTANTYYQEAIALFEASGDSAGYVSALYESATVEIRRGADSIGDPMLEKAAAIAHRQSNWAALATILNFKGVFRFNQGLYEEALPLMLQSQRLYEQLERSQDQARTLNMIGSALYRMGEVEKAIEYLNQALDVAKEGEYLQIKASILTNLGVIEEENGAGEAGLAHLLEALELYRTLDIKYGESSCLTNIAIYYEKQQEFQLAANYQREAFKIDQSTGDLIGQTISLCNLGEFSRQMGNWAEALGHYRSSDSLAKSLGVVALDSVLLSGMGTCYKKLGDFERALACSEGLAEIQREKASEAKADSAKANLWEYEEEKQDAIISALEAENDFQGTWLAIFGSLAGVGLLALVLVWRARKKEKGKMEGLEKELQLKTLENKGLNQDVQALRENLKVKQELIAHLQQQEPGRPKPEIYRAAFIDKAKSQGAWNGFMIEFELLYPNFLQQLKQQHPSLTQNDLRFLSLIKLNLSTPEIADFLNITPAGVKKARQRIRKKLGLASNLRLAHFLENI